MTVKELIAKLQVLVADGLPEDTVVERIGPMGRGRDAIVAVPYGPDRVMLMPVRDAKMAAAFKARAEALKEKV